MEKLARILVFSCLVVLAGGAAGPDLVMPGYKIVAKDMRVDPGAVAKTHFVFALAGGTVTEVGTEVRIRAYMWETRVYAMPLGNKDEVLGRLADATKRAQKYPRPSDVETPQQILASFPRSEPLENREVVVESDPTATIEVRYEVTGVKDDEVVLKKTRRLLDKDGKEITQQEVEKQRRSFSALLAFVAAVGVVGLGFVIAKRASVA